MTGLLALPAAFLLMAAPHVTGASFDQRDVGREGLGPAMRALAASGGAAWAGWAVPAVEGRGRLCCFDDIRSVNDDPRCCTTCRLEQRQSHGSFSGDHAGADVALEPAGTVLVLLRLAEGRVGRIRVVSTDCAIDTGPLPFHLLEGVDPVSSVDYLARLVTPDEAGRRDDGEDGLSGEALAAIAMHAGPQADRALERFVARSQPAALREQAAFWIGQSRGQAGFAILKPLLDSDPDPDFRRKVLFALSQNPAPGATDAMIAAAHADRDPAVRAEAIFWLAQKAGDKAARAITDAIENDPETEVKKKAVFALSQLPGDEGITHLLKLAKSHPNPAVRKEAIFWLGQSGDPRALDLIERILGS